MFIIGIALGGLFTMLLWNALIPDLFHGPTLSYLQAAGMLVLARIMVGRGGRGHHWRKFRHHAKHYGWGHSTYNGPEGSWSGPWWSAPWFQEKKEWKKCHNMSPEERRKMKEEWKSKFRSEWQSPPESQDPPRA